jgi:hypothetical protein
LKIVNMADILPVPGLNRPRIWHPARSKALVGVTPINQPTGGIHKPEHLKKRVTSG